METHRQRWDRELLEALHGAVGEVVVEVHVCEMALYPGDDAPFFTHPQLKFVQAQFLELRLENGHALTFGTAQDDDEWGIWPKRCAVDEGRLKPKDAAPDSFFRTRSMPEFPLGQIVAVTHEKTDRGNIQKITLSVGGREVILKAGEVYRENDGRLKILEWDESVLVFIDPRDYRETVFGEAVYSIP
jgi:hypothetical protein